MDFYCTLMERKQRLLVPLAYYAAQVKSTMDPWIFKTADEVRWFIEYPMSIFLCVITKRESRIRVYHTSPRFCVWASHSKLPKRLELIPGEGTEGMCTQWTGGTSFSLSAPILDFRLSRPDTDEDFRGRAAAILKSWIDVDEENMEKVKFGLREFKMPDHYKTNVLSPTGTVIQGLTIVDKGDLDRAISHLKDPLSAVADQLFKHGDLLSAVRGILLLRQLYWDSRHLPLAIGRHANTLNGLLDKSASPYLHQAIDQLGKQLDLRILKSGAGSELFARVQRVFLEGREVTDAVIAPLKGARELKWLHLCNTSVTDKGLKCIEGQANLRELLLSDTQITDAGVKRLRKLKQLVILNLCQTKVTNEGMKHLKPFALLENLYLNGTRVTDEGLRYVGKLPRLERLTLEGTRITDKGLVYLRGAKHLCRLYRANTAITDKAAAELQKKIPGLAVIPAPPGGSEDDAEA